MLRGTAVTNGHLVTILHAEPGATFPGAEQTTRTTISHFSRKRNNHFDDVHFAQIVLFYEFSTISASQVRILGASREGEAVFVFCCEAASVAGKVSFVRNIVSFRLITQQHPPGFGATWKSWFRSICTSWFGIISLPSVCFGLLVRRGATKERVNCVPMVAVRCLAQAESGRYLQFCWPFTEICFCVISAWMGDIKFAKIIEPIGAEHTADAFPTGDGSGRLTKAQCVSRKK